MEVILYKDCVYDGDCRLPPVPDFVADAKEYIYDVELLVNWQGA